VQTPLAHATFPFTYWRGGLKYRFRIMASDLHRGRLLFVYDPKGFSSNTMPDTNTAFSRIIDLEETKDFTLPIHWFQTKSWAKVPTTPTSGSIASGTVSTDSQVDESNGQLKIFILNELTSPDEDLTNSVRILLFISGADDYEVAVPQDNFIRRTAFGGSFEHWTFNTNGAWSQSGIISQSGLLNNAKAAQAAKPGCEGSEMLEPIGSASKHNALALVYNGETFDTFRDLLKRYNFSGAFVKGENSDLGGLSTLFRVHLPNFPMYNGRAATNGMYQQARPGGLNAVNFNISGRTLLNWLTPAYAARRGGIRYKYMFGLHKNHSIFSIQASRAPSGFSPGFGTGEYALNTSTTNKHGPYSQVQNTAHGGTAHTNGQVPVLEIELPYYSDRKFEDASDIVTETQYNNYQTHYLEIYDGARQQGGNLQIYQYVATGEDFNLTWYVNAPSFFLQEYRLIP
jgi:hypothetical protein